MKTLTKDKNGLVSQQERHVLVWDSKKSINEKLDCFGIPRKKRRLVRGVNKYYAAVELGEDNYVYLCLHQKYGNKDQLALCQESSCLK